MELILFHHAQGLTDGVRAFADDLRAAGHTVHLPDLFDGNKFPELSGGMAFVEELGFGTMIERGMAAAGGLRDDLIYAGISLGALPAQALAQNRPGARGALLVSGFIPPSELGTWPEGLPVQVHMMEDDEVAAEDLEAARDFDAAELFLYPGDSHLFIDRSLTDYDEHAAAEATDRILEFLDL